MSEEVSLKTPLFVFKEDNPLSYPQKCKIPQNIINFPASSLIIVKGEENKQYICRLYYLNGCYDLKSLTYIDTSVEINAGRELSEINYVEKIKLIERSKIVKFTNIRVRVFVDQDRLDLNIIKCTDDLIKGTKSILKHFTFTKDCSISCDRFGIKRIHVIATSDINKFGNLEENGKLEIDEVFVARDSFKNNCMLGGLKNAEEKLQQMILNNAEYRKNPDKFPIRPSCHALIYGPIGCGKTSLIQYISNKLNCNMFEIYSDIFKPYPGETEQELEKIFNRITKISNLISSNVSIILIENIELFCPKVNMKLKENSHSSRIASLIYSYLDEISNRTKGILVIGTTSKMELVNIALRRLNRMGIEISLEMPDENQRCEITKILINRMLENQIEIEDVEELSRYVAVNTTGFVGADLEVLCQFVMRQHETIQQNADIKYLFESGFQKITPSTMRDNLGTITRSTMCLKDIGGMEDLKKTLLTCILGPLKHPQKFKRFGLHSPSGILLYGPSGCAKTTIVKCLAGESKMTLISVSSAEIYSPYVGEAEKFIVRLFNQARLSAPAILFFDEIDTIVGNRSHSNGTNDAHMRILSTILTEIDGFSGNSTVNRNKPILIIGATNRPECIDDALMRPGRFDKLIHIPAPDYEYRLQILQFLFKKMPVADDVNIQDIARRSEFFSGADLVNLCNEAAICAATKDLNCVTIKMEDFENVLTFLQPSLNEEKIRYYENFQQRHAGRT